MNEFISKIIGALSPAASHIPSHGGDQPNIYTQPTIFSRHMDVVVEEHTKQRELIEKHAPFRRKGCTILHEPVSVADFVKRFSDSGSVMFVDTTAPAIEVVINYDHAGPESYAVEAEATGVKGRDETARPGDHVAKYSFPISDEFTRWMNVGKVGLSQEALGDFVDQSINDFFPPTPALASGDRTLLGDQAWEQNLFDLAKRLGARFGGYGDLRQLATSFEVDETSTVKVSRNPQTGEASFQMQSAHNTPTGEAIRLPGLFIIAIPIFRGGPSYRAPVRFAYRKSGAKLAFFLEVFNIEEVKRNAINATVAEIVENTKSPAEGDDMGLACGGLPDGIPVIWGRRGER